MSKKHSIKIDDEVYLKLDEFRWKRETFSQVIDRLLTLMEKAGELRAFLEEQVTSKNRQREELAAQAPHE